VKPGTVTFNVNWKKAGMPTLWSDSVWVFVDYNKNGVMTRLPVTSATATAGTVEKISGNDTGVRLIGNARGAGSFSATVQLLTSQLDVAGACAYASNYPPVGEYTSSTKISFTGTPPYDLVLTSAESGTYTYSINDSYYHLHEGETFKSFSDKTGAPGTIRNNLTPPPPGALTSKIWVIGDQIWSDALAKAQSGCTSGSSFTAYPTPDGAYYTLHNQTVVGYMYNAKCVSEQGTNLCPTPWRVPSAADYCTLARTLFDEETCVNKTAQSKDAVWSAYFIRWGATPVGYWGIDHFVGLFTVAEYWTTSLGGSWSTSMAIGVNGVTSNHSSYSSDLKLLRCVK
jgi:uncharacterized protein (TIGR02145 family)